MAVKNNAKPANKAEPAAGAAMAETIDGAVEQAVVSPATDEAALENFAVPVKAAVAELGKFFEFCNHVFAAALEGAEVRIRDNGLERSATADDLLAVNLKGQTVTIVTRDGQKHTLKEGANNEAQ